ncbi:MAG: response regulator [Elusimicrobia bacterium]|nr:response regulator [Elusimicrobiota bacterium]
MPLDILVVDDSKVMRAIIIRALRLSGLALGDVREAGDGREGLAALRRRRADVVITDINMPVMDGEALVDAMRGDPALAGVPVLVVSTESSQARISILEGKTAGFVRKPFTPERIRGLISTIVGVSDDERTGQGAVSSGGPDF